VEQLTWANCLLFPPAVAKRLLERLQPVQRDNEPDLWQPPEPLNTLLESTIAIESQVIPRNLPLPFGLSVMALARAV
jgi:hypothetical protein